MALAHDTLESVVHSLRSQTPAEPAVALVLGSGLGEFAEKLRVTTAIDTAALPGYPGTTIEGHRGRILFADYAKTSLLLFQGRNHLYESNDPSRVVFPIRLARALGARFLVVTNAAGGVNRNLRSGDLMLIEDQVNLTMMRGPAGVGGIRPGTVRMYDPDLMLLALEASSRAEVPLMRGVYAGVKGPTYETAAEIEMITRIGGDAVGMSTVFEVEEAARLGMRTLGISLITNLATGISGEKLSHQEVTAIAGASATRFERLMKEILEGFRSRI